MKVGVGLCLYSNALQPNEGLMYKNALLGIKRECGSCTGAAISSGGRAVVRQSEGCVPIGVEMGE